MKSSAKRRKAGRVGEVHYELLRPAQAVRRRRELPLAYLPLGVIEWHGLQNPLGLDGLKVHELCVRAAAQGGGLVFPPVWYGENRLSHLAEINPPVRRPVARAMRLPASGFDARSTSPAAVLAQVTFYQELLLRILEQIHRLGFEAAFALAGHGPLKAPAQVVAQVVERTTGMRIAVAHAADLVAGYGEDHAGRFETGVMMALRPELVDLKQIARFRKSELVGIKGLDPRQGSAELGDAFVPACTEALIRAGRELIRRKPSTGAMSVR